jgi:hypothetical protein
MSLTYNKSGDIITIIVQDPSYKKVGQWKFNTADTELGNGIFRHLQRKYGFTPEIKPKDNVPSKEQNEEDW